jgi:hypothetical protein
VERIKRFARRKFFVLKSKHGESPHALCLRVQIEYRSAVYRDKIGLENMIFPNEITETNWGSVSLRGRSGDRPTRSSDRLLTESEPGFLSRFLILCRGFYELTRSSKSCRIHFFRCVDFLSNFF